jgi:alpha-D-xyloside xylohydrolase
MVMEYTDDAACAYLERQYMLGESIVVAPIFNQNGSSEIYLPEGTFTHLLTNETIRGGRYIRRTYDYFSLPLWVRPNSILAMLEESEADKGTTYDSSTPMLFHIYEPEESAIANLYDSRGDIMCTIHANSDGNRVTVRFEGKCPGGTVRVSRKGQTGTAPIDKEAAEAVVLLS